MIRALVLLLALALPAVAGAASLPDGAETVEYVRTIDGDTIVVRDAAGQELHVRLFGVDCGELKEGTVAAFAGAIYTARCLEELANGVAIERDEAALVDSFGRTLAWVWYRPSGSDGWKLLNACLVGSGSGTVYEECQSKLHLWEVRQAAGGHCPYCGPTCGIARE